MAGKGGAATAADLRCTYCGGRGHGPLLEVDLRGIRYDYCDAACATAHQQEVALWSLSCADCGEDASGDTGSCGEHLEPIVLELETAWRRAG